MQFFQIWIQMLDKSDPDEEETQPGLGTLLEIAAKLGALLERLCEISY